MTQLRNGPQRQSAPVSAEIVAIEGVIDDVSLRGGLHAYVRDPLDGRRTRINARLSRTEEVAATLGRRVALTGEGILNGAGDIVAVELEQLDLLPRDEESPPLAELLADLRTIDLTEGVPAEVFVRRLRGD